MNNVNNRKLFRKSQSARNKLREIGGIMASDAELMQTVAEYNQGGPVGFKDGDVVRIPTRGRGFVMQPGTGVGPGYANKFPMVINQPKTPGILSRTLRGTPGLSTAYSSLEQRFDPFDTEVMAQQIPAYQARQNTAPGITREQFDAMGPREQQAYIDRFNASRYITESVPAQIREGLSVITDPIQDLYEGIASTEIGQRIAGAISPGTADEPFESTPRRRNEQAAIEDQIRNRPLTRSQFRLSLPSSAPEVGADRATTEEQYMMGPGAAIPEPTMPVPDMPEENLTQQERDDTARIAAEQAAATEAAGAPQFKQTDPVTGFDEGDLEEAVAKSPMPERTATQEAKEGKYGTKAQVSAIIDAGTPKEQQDQLKTLMAEFTQSAPEYQGMDQGLAIAKIGFAMAAGKSSNAIQNIASALEKGADEFIKDKRERDAFNRQIQLSALQYGLGEVGKQRAERRLAAREGRKLTYWVADKDMKFNGIEYKKNETVAIPQGFIEKEGLPPGITLPTMAKASLEANAKYKKFLQEQKEKGIITDEAYRKNSERMTQAATDFSSSNQLRELLNSQIVSVAEGKVTGLSNAGAALINRFANAAGVNLGEKFESKEAYDMAMQKVANKMVNELLGEGSKTMSDMDRRLAQEIVGYYGAGLFDYAFVDQDLLLQKVQSTLVEVENKNRRSLNTMRDIIDSSAGKTFYSGRPVVYREALATAGPYLSEGQAGGFGLTKVGEENGLPVYDFSK